LKNIVLKQLKDTQFNELASTSNTKVPSRMHGLANKKFGHAHRVIIHLIVLQSGDGCTGTVSTNPHHFNKKVIKQEHLSPAHHTSLL
jgi:hypothetical protein